MAIFAALTTCQTPGKSKQQKSQFKAREDSLRLSGDEIEHVRGSEQIVTQTENGRHETLQRAENFRSYVRSPPLISESRCQAPNLFISDVRM